MQILSECNLAQLVVELLNGKTVVFPTETSYGLGCDATNKEAVDKIFKIKGRGSNKPLLVVVPSVAEAKKYLVWNETLDSLASKYWPGALTIVGEANPHPNPLRCDGEGSDVSNSVSSGEGGGIQTHSAAAEGGGGGFVNRLFSFEKIKGLSKTLQFRREMRKEPTKAEKNLWPHLRNKRLGGFKFHRQHGIGPYIVDFYNPETRTIIEIDGDIHFVEDKNVVNDQKRQQWLEQNGYKVLRYNNVDVFGNLEWILEELYNELARPLPNPPLCEGEGTRDLSLTLPFAKGRERQLANGVVSKAGTLALRVTANPLLKSITEKLGRPLVATSANISDAGDIYSAEEIINQFKNRGQRPDIVLNYGELVKRMPTTIVSVVGGELKVLRQGEVKIKNEE